LLIERTGHTELLMEILSNFVAGRWTPATGASAVVRSPIDGEVVHEVRFAGEAEVDAALAAARAVLPRARDLPKSRRSQALRELAAGLKRRAPDIAEIIVRENGCPSKNALNLQALNAGALLDSFATLAADHSFETTREGLRGGRVIVQKVPVGVCVGVTPWNVPVFLNCVKIAGAIAAGVPLVLKPSPETIGTTTLLAQALAELDLPAGMISVLHGERDVGRRLVEDERVAKVSFTGSARAGAEVAVACARRFARCTLELGGKSAAIFLDDVELPAVLPELLAAMLQNNGQVCGAQTRLLIPRRRYEDILAALGAAFTALQVGDPRRQETDIGPIISAAQRDKIETIVAATVRDGARVIAGGDRPAALPPGHFVAPTLLADVSPSMPIWREELFGPVIVACPYDTEEEAITLANDSPYGLSGSVWSPDLNRGAAIAARISSGTVSLNSRRVLDFGSPFGGLGQSGIGRELGPEGIDAFLESHAIIIAEATH
jgi:acyl-CoA reductase-like NAD-dependent aldehyde dehydrogenase